MCVKLRRAKFQRRTAKHFKFGVEWTAGGRKMCVLQRIISYISKTV